MPKNLGTYQPEQTNEMDQWKQCEKQYQWFLAYKHEIMRYGTGQIKHRRPWWSKEDK